MSKLLLVIIAIVLLDVGLSGVNGCEVAQRLRHHQNFKLLDGLPSGVRHLSRARVDRKSSVVHPVEWVGLR